MASGDPVPDGERPRPLLPIPRVTTSELNRAIQRVDTPLVVDADSEADAITHVDSMRLTSTGDGGSAAGKERGEDAADADGGSWGDLHDAIQRVDTSPVVGATDSPAGPTPAAAAAATPPASGDDPDGKGQNNSNNDNSSDGGGGGSGGGDSDGTAAAGGGAAPGAPGATAASGPTAAVLRQRPPRPSKAQLQHMRAGMLAARAASALSSGGGGGGGGGGDGASGGGGVDGGGEAGGGRGGRSGGGGGVRMPTPRVVVDVDPAEAVGVVQTPGPGGAGSLARARPPSAGAAPRDPLQSFAE